MASPIAENHKTKTRSTPDRVHCHSFFRFPVFWFSGFHGCGVGISNRDLPLDCTRSFDALWIVVIEYLEYHSLSGDPREWCPGGGAGKPKTSPTRPRQFRNHIRKGNHVGIAEFAKKKCSSYPAYPREGTSDPSERVRCLWKYQPLAARWMSSKSQVERSNRALTWT